MTKETKINDTRTITESMLSNTYGDNGVVLQSMDDAKALLKRKGYTKQNGLYRNKVGKQAFIYKVRDSKLTKDSSYRDIKIKGYDHQGFLVSFGGEPRSCYELKFTKIPRPIV